MVGAAGGGLHMFTGRASKCYVAKANLFEASMIFCFKAAVAVWQRYHAQVLNLLEFSKKMAGAMRNDGGIKRASFWKLNCKVMATHRLYSSSWFSLN